MPSLTPLCVSYRPKLYLMAPLASNKIGIMWCSGKALTTQFQIDQDQLLRLWKELNFAIY